MVGSAVDVFVARFQFGPTREVILSLSGIEYRLVLFGIIVVLVHIVVLGLFVFVHYN